MTAALAGCAGLLGLDDVVYPNDHGDAGPDAAIDAGGGVDASTADGELPGCRFIANPEPLASGLGVPTSLRADSKFVYYLDSRNGGNVGRVSTSTGAVERVYDGLLGQQLVGVGLRDSLVLWLGTSELQARTTDLASPAFTILQQPSMNTIAFEPGRVYIADEIAHVAWCPLEAGCAGGPTALENTVTTNGPFAALDGNVYFVGLDPLSGYLQGIWRCPRSGCADANAGEPLVNGLLYIGGLSANPTGLYFVDGMDGHVVRMPLDAGPQSADGAASLEYVVSGEPEPLVLSTDGDWLYWMAKGRSDAGSDADAPPQIVRARRDGGARTTLAIGTFPYSPPTTDDCYVYWSDLGGTIYRTSKVP